MLGYDNNPSMEGFSPMVVEINECFVKLSSECDIVFDPESPPKGLNLGYNVIK